MDSSSASPLRPEFADGSRPIRVIVQPPRASWIGAAIKWAVILLVAMVVIGSFNPSYQGDNKVEERWHSLSKTASDRVAIIRIEGAIFGDEGFIKRQIDHVREDENVKAIVLRIDSPGGTVTGSDYIYHHLKKLLEARRIPLVVSMGSVAASGGYYVAMAAGDEEDRIFAEPTTWTGSIGVIIPHYNFSGLLSEWKVEDDSIASNPLKMMGSLTRKFPEPVRAEEQQILKGLVDASFADFKDIVLASRKALRGDQAAQDAAFTGRIFTAKQAQQNHLVDRLGFVEDAIDRAIELANLNKSSVRVVQYHKPTTLMETLLLGNQTSGKSSWNLSALVELASPKAYYLCTWLPALEAVAR